MRYIPRGTCAKSIEFEIHNGVVNSVRFEGGCKGNHLGIEALVEGKGIDEVIAALDGIQCRNSTSCPDQLAQALKKFKLEQEI